MPEVTDEPRFWHCPSPPSHYGRSMRSLSRTQPQMADPFPLPLTLFESKTFPSVKHPPFPKTHTQLHETWGFLTSHHGRFSVTASSSWDCETKADKNHEEESLRHIPVWHEAFPVSEEKLTGLQPHFYTLRLCFCEWRALQGTLVSQGQCSTVFSDFPLFLS